MFSSTEASTSQWESSVFVSPIKAPALMILDEYGADERGRLSGSVGLAGMALAHRLPEFEFESLSILFDHLLPAAPRPTHARLWFWLVQKRPC